MEQEPYKTKCQALMNQITALTSQDIAVAFSGGVDSSLLLKIACEKAKTAGTRVYAITIHTMLHPVGELELTKKVAEETGAIHRIIKVDELKEAGIAKNPVDRCYLCKRYMFKRLLKEADQLQVKTAIEGTNEDDTRAYRPGIAALRELGIKSPLLEAGFTKADVRRLAGELNISVANRPSAPCLATRFPYDTVLSYEEMKKVDEIEVYLRNQGFYNVRARIHGELVRLEVDAADIPLLVQQRTELAERIKRLGYSYVTADLEGFRSGSQDIHVVREKQNE